jgi:predicted Zn-dependent protease
VTFTVVDSEQANAFVLPGNHVFGTYPQRIISVVIR